MKLTLEVLSHQKQSMGAESICVFDEQGGTLGRNDNNTWVLMDQKRYISSYHAEIKFQAGEFYLLDTSSNGVYLNQATRPIGKGQQERLSNGDKIRIADYEIQVTVSGGPTAMPDPMPPRASDEILDGDSVIPSSIDSILGSRDLDKLAPIDDKVLSGEDSSGLGSSDINDVLNERMGGDDVVDNGRDVQPDHRSAIHDHINIGPAVSGNSGRGGGLPADWNEPLSARQPERPTGSRPVKEPSPRVGAKPEPSSEKEYSFSYLKPKTGAPAKEADAQPPSIAGDDYSFPQLKPEEARSKLQEPPLEPPAVQQIPETRKIDEPRPVSQPAVSPPVEPRRPEAGRYAASSANSSALVQAFMEAAGLPPDTKFPRDDLEQMRLLGQLFHDMIQGLADLLRSRTSIKSEFRMAVTQIKPAENNPLKFSVGMHATLYNLLVRSDAGYLPPRAAVHEAFEDLKDHEVAMVAGMKAALDSLLTVFDPHKLEEEAEGRVGLLGNKKAVCWEEYEEHYNNIARQAQEKFQSLFGEPFADAYEQQIEHLARLRKSRN